VSSATVRTWLAAGCLLLPLASCIPSNVVARDDRMVVTQVADLRFVPAPALQLDGLFESIEITGDAAVTLQKVYYLFRADGTYTAAALVAIDGIASFQTLSGTWTSLAGGLVLDGAEPVQLEQAPEHLRITAPNGALVLRRGTLQ